MCQQAIVGAGNISVQQLWKQLHIHSKSLYASHIQRGNKDNMRANLLRNRIRHGIYKSVDFISHGLGFESHGETAEVLYSTTTHSAKRSNRLLEERHLDRQRRRQVWFGKHSCTRRIKYTVGTLFERGQPRGSAGLRCRVHAVLPMLIHNTFSELCWVREIRGHNDWPTLILLH